MKNSHWNFMFWEGFICDTASPETLVRALRMKGYLNFWKVRKFAFRVGKNEKY